MTVNEEQPRKEPELSDGVVGRVDSLQTLFSRNSNSDISSLDHRDIVGSVSDSEGHDSEVVFDEVNDLGFLKGRDSAADDGVATGGQLEEEILGPGFGESLREEEEVS